MKKVLVLAAAALLFATPALAAVSGTAHDLSLINGGTSTQICVYCHTPHSADTTVANAPLWNRDVANATAVYAGVDLEATTIAQMTVANVNQTDAPLCLSCHDGVIGNALQNAPNDGTVAGLDTYTFANTAAVLDTDLTDDHPIAFSYGDAQGTDAELQAAPALPFFTQDLGAGAVNDVMWCSSCHDVHDDTFSPFLQVDNAGSALCLTCHIK